MAITDSSLNTSLIGELFIERLRTELTQQAIDAIRPAITKSVDRVIAEMQPQLQDFVDLQKRETIIRIVAKGYGV